MKVIYTAGPYNGTDHLDIKQHILNASKVAIECWKKGWAVICPHKNTGGYEGYEGDGVDWNTWIKGDLEILKRCDAIVMVEDWEESKGANMELEKAKEWGLDIYYSVDEVPRVRPYHYDIGQNIDKVRERETERESDFIF